MKKTKFLLAVCECFFLTLMFFSNVALSMEITSSVLGGIGEGAHGENGTLIIGVNLKSKTLSGYYESNDITGNVTAECKFYFEGKLESQNVENIQITTAHPDFMREKPEVVNGKIEFQPKSPKPTVIVYLNQIPRSCDWLYNGLPSYIPPQNFSLKNGLTYEFERSGNWQAVSVIKSKRSYFYTKPDERGKGKAFVVAGDLIYIYDEKPNWYYVKYKNEKNGETSGWIKKSDTIQFSESR